MPRGFPKEGSRERIFFEKLGLLGSKILKFCVLRAKILAKSKAENAFFSLKLLMGGSLVSSLQEWERLVLIMIEGAGKVLSRVGEG